MLADSSPTGAPPAIIPRMGGSICNDLFTDLPGLPAIWLAHSYVARSRFNPGAGKG